MSHPIVTTVSLVAAVTNGIAQAQALPGASGLNAVLNGSKVVAGVAVLDAPRRVVVTSAGDDSGITFTVTGTRGTWWAQQTITETFAGANGAAVSTQDFLTVTSFSSSAATASTIQVGTNGTGSGPWVVWDRYTDDFAVSMVGNIVSGAPAWGVDYTYDDVFGLWLPANVTFPRSLPFIELQGLLVAADASLTNGGVKATRLTLTAVGSAQLTQQQQGG